MRIFIFEYLTANNIGVDPFSSDHSMYREGLAMRDTLTKDLVESGHRVHHDVNSDAEVAIIIAPESEEILLNQCKSLKMRYRVFNCDDESIKNTGDKLQLYYIWNGNGVNTPETTSWRHWPKHRLPVIAKPNWGVGSTDVFLLNQAADWRCETDVRFMEEDFKSKMIVQDYIPGRSASIAFLIGPKQTIAMQPTFQVLSDDGRFHYLGGELPIRPDLAARAIKLGRQAVDCVPGLAGYVGVDLILGDADDGSQDFAIEINPRLTTSYVGLRQLADFNIAQMMIDVFEGKPVAEPTWKPGRVRFYPDGKVDYDPTPGAVFE